MAATDAANVAWPDTVCEGAGCMRRGRQNVAFSVIV